MIDYLLDSWGGVIFENIQHWIQVNDIFDIFLKGFLIYVAIFWISLVICVTRDSIHRSNNILFQALAILLNTILPIFGLIIYLLIRPSKTLLESYYDEVELKALNNEKYCEKCGTIVHDNFYYCPECGVSLKKECKFCGQKIFTMYKICPLCGNLKKNKKTIAKKKVENKLDKKKDKK